MSKVVLFGVDLHGHVNPTLGLVSKLIERGEEVVYYCSDAFRDKIERAGASFRSYRGLLGFSTHKGSGIDTFLVFADFLMDRSRILTSALYDEVAQLSPDYVIHDAFGLWGKEIAAKLDIPGIAFFANFPFIDEMADRDPEFFMEYVLRAQGDPLYERNRGKHDVYRKLLDRLSGMIARRYNLPPMNVINDVFCSKQPLNLLFTSREFQIYEDVFDDTHLFAGYSLYPRLEPVDFPYELLDGRPLVYIAFGTILSELNDAYETCFSALGDSRYQVVMSVGKTDLARLRGEIPANFIVRSYVPQLDILSRAAVFITHGGANSIYESLCSGVPMVVLPQVFDEYMGALMVERAEAGIYLRDTRVDADSLREAVDRAASLPEYKEGCTKVRDSFERTGGLDHAVDEIIKFAKQKVYDDAY
ncbi:macrolide family glycosyltransferase [Paenibacillus sp. NPDC057967]|uniref:macrolide family glycosyltransferase n=1 Tax=Paenibacillus sp. NPDC057967 TaxID=3346293 RepID=UPI0036DF2BC8